MAKITFKGLEAYIRELEKLKGDEEVMISRSIYPGAAIIANEIKSGMGNMKTREDGKMYRHGEMAPGPTEQEKADMISYFGLAPMRNDSGFINTKAGFDGYGHHKTKSYPKGVPNALVARACESGTSWMQKQPFMREAVNAARKPAQKAIREAFDEEIRKRMG